MSEQLTHWKLLTDYDYLGSHNMPIDGSDVILTISRVESKPVGEDKKRKPVLYWQESGWKPMIANNTNCTIIGSIYKSMHVEKWIGCKVQIYVLKNYKAFGKLQDVLRIRAFVPKVSDHSKPTPEMTITPDDISDAQFKLEQAETLEQLAQVWSALTPQIKAIPSVLATKEQCKANLTKTE